METEANFRILLIYFFFGIKNVGVGRSIGNTYIFLGLIQHSLKLGGTNYHFKWVPGTSLTKRPTPVDSLTLVAYFRKGGCI